MADKINGHGSGQGAGRKVLTPVKGSVRTIKHAAGLHQTLKGKK